MPSLSVSSSTMPIRSPSTPAFELGEQRRRGLGDRRGVARIVARRSLRAAAPRRRPTSRTGRSGRATTRTRSARSATPRRRSASRRRRRTATRAGAPSRRCRSRARAARSPAATAAAEPPLDPPGTRDEVVRVARRAERGVLGGAAHRELVEVGLADRRPRPRRAARSHDRRVVRRQPAFEDPRRARGGHAPRAEVVLQRDRHAGERARDRRPARPPRRSRRRAPARRRRARG